MTYYLYSIYDKLTDTYNIPVTTISDSAAARDFEDACLSPNNPFIKHPTDYTLMLIGSIDMNTGEIKGIEPTPIARATDFVEREVNNG